MTTLADTGEVDADPAEPCWPQPTAPRSYGEAKAAAVLATIGLYCTFRVAIRWNGIDRELTVTMIGLAVLALVLLRCSLRGKAGLVPKRSVRIMRSEGVPWWRRDGKWSKAFAAWQGKSARDAQRDAAEIRRI